MINKLIDKTKSEDLLFLSAVIINILNEAEKLKKECSILPELFTTLGVDTTINMIKYFGGETIRVPSHEEMHRAFLVIVCYYKKKIEDKSWDDIKKELSIDISPHTLGKLIELIDGRITTSLEDLKNYGIKEYIEKMEEELNV
jgi:hypothetical protein